MLSPLCSACAVRENKEVGVARALPMLPLSVSGELDVFPTTGDVLLGLV